MSADLTKSEQAAIKRVQADQAAFEVWCKTEGLPVTPAKEMECWDGRFPATYWNPNTETSWRAWANKPAPAQGALSDAEIEKQFMAAGGRWDGNRWTIEDADMYPMVRAFRGQVSDAADAALDMDEAQWEAHKVKLAAQYPGIAAGYAVVEVLIETESGCNVAAGEWGFSISRILHGAIKSDDWDAIHDSVAQIIADGDVVLPAEGITPVIVYESGERQDVFWCKFYRLAAMQAQAVDAT